MGVLAPLVGVIGTMQAMEAVKILSGMGSRLVGKLLMLDGRDVGLCLGIVAVQVLL
jgi:molybdopterin/thiamine biosynthesis adenylyltransferase